MAFSSSIIALRNLNSFFVSPRKKVPRFETSLDSFFVGKMNMKIFHFCHKILVCRKNTDP